MKKNNILLVGGGSGGHITPLVSIADELKKQSATLEINCFCDKKNFGLAKQLFEQTDVKITPIISGKFRRYNHLKWYQHLVPSIFLSNLIDLFKIFFAFFQCLFLTIKIKPKVIFAKGGYPCLPFGIIAKITKTDLIIHDSDVVAGLTNKILSKNASLILTGMPTKYYNYPDNKTKFVGTPLRLNSKTAHQIKKELGFDSKKKLIIMTGGGLGANYINDLSFKLAKKRSNYQIILFSGKRDYQRINNLNNFENLQIIDFANNFSDYLLISNLVISRAGATTIAEIASYKKAALLIPSHKLTGNHQIKNARILSDAKAMNVILESEINQDFNKFLKLVDDSIDNLGLIKNVNQFSSKKSSQKISKILFDRLSNEK